MKLWSIFKILSVIDLQELWMTKNVNLLKFYSSFTSSTSLMSLLNDMPLTPSILMTLLKLPIQSDCHLLSKGTPCQNQQSSMTKTRQSGHLKKSWIYDIQNQIITFSIRFADLTVTLILSDIMQMMMNFKTYLKFYRNIMCDILTNQICSLLNWGWFAINQQGQVERKSEMWSQRLF